MGEGEAQELPGGQRGETPLQIPALLAVNTCPQERISFPFCICSEGKAQLHGIFWTSQGCPGAARRLRQAGTRDLPAQFLRSELFVAAWQENPELCCNFFFLGRRRWSS